MSNTNVNRIAERAPLLAGSNLLHYATYYYMVWTALGAADTFEEWRSFFSELEDLFDAARERMHPEDFEDMLTLCED